MTDAIPTNMASFECMSCRKKGLWKVLPYEEGKPTRYECLSCHEVIKQSEDKCMYQNDSCQDCPDKERCVN